MAKDNSTFSAADRLHLIQALNTLPETQFNELVFALNPPKGNIPSNSAPQGDRSIALLNWIESPIGPGLGEPEMVLASLMGNQVQTIEPPATYPRSLEALREIIQTLSQNKTPRYDLRGAQFAGGFSEIVHGNQIGGVINNYSQNTDDIIRLLSSLSELSQVFPEAQQQQVQVHLEDLATDIKQPDKRSPERLKTLLACLFGVLILLGGGIATATDFANNILELSKKLNVSAEVFQPQLQKIKQIYPDFDWHI
jgi:hypothetical protein